MQGAVWEGTQSSSFEEIFQKGRGHSISDLLVGDRSSWKIEQSF